MESSAESTTESTAEPDSGRGPRPTCPYWLVCPLTSRPQHRVCEVKKQTRDGTGKRNKKKNKRRRRGGGGETRREPAARTTRSPGCRAQERQRTQEGRPRARSQATG